MNIQLFLLTIQSQSSFKKNENPRNKMNEYKKIRKNGSKNAI